MATTQEFFNLHIPALDSGGKIAIVLGLVFLVFIFKASTQDLPFDGFNVIGLEKGAWTYIKAKIGYLRDAKGLLMKGLSSKKPFQLIGLAGPEIIFPSSYVNELKGDKRLSFTGFVKREMFPYYPGFEGSRVGVETHVVTDMVRIKLTQSLNLVTKDLCEETEFATEKLFGSPTEWTPCMFPKVAPNFVARLSTRVFLGEVVARDEDWLNIAVNYTIDIMIASRALKMVPAITRGIVHWFLPQCRSLRKHYATARAIIGEEIARRKIKWENDAKEGKPVSKTADTLAWMQELSNGQPFDLAAGQLSLTFAAIHTTSDLVTKAIIAVCRNPEHVDAIRKEMVEVLGQEGMKKTSLYKMRFLDSFLKEVQRMEPPSMTTMARVADEEIHLKDGTLIPKGGYLKIFMDSNFNDDVFPGAASFDPHRFLNLRNQPGQENNWQFVTTGQDSLGFGHGPHACPGRFFASNEVKIALCWLLLKYDWKLEDGVECPASMRLGTEIIAHPKTKLLYRRRKEELNLRALYEEEA